MLWYILLTYNLLCYACQVLFNENVRRVKLTWVPYHVEKGLPQGAVIAGHSEDGYPIYPALATYYQNDQSKTIRGSYDARHVYAEYIQRGAKSSTEWKILVLQYGEYLVTLIPHVYISLGYLCNIRVEPTTNCNSNETYVILFQIYSCITY